MEYSYFSFDNLPPRFRTYSKDSGSCTTSSSSPTLSPNPKSAPIELPEGFPLDEYYFNFLNEDDKIPVNKMSPSFNFNNKTGFDFKPSIGNSDIPYSSGMDDSTGCMSPFDQMHQRMANLNLSTTVQHRIPSRGQLKPKWIKCQPRATVPFKSSNFGQRPRYRKMRKIGEPAMECAFCKNNEKPYDHPMKNKRDDVVCPILSVLSCPLCGATGKKAHTQRYCPYAEEEKQRELEEKVLHG